MTVSDLALVFSESLAELPRPTANNRHFISVLAQLVAHEAGHLIGLEHDDDHYHDQDAHQFQDEVIAAFSEVAMATTALEGAIDWEENGPQTISDKNLADSGAIQAVLSHPVNADIAYVGTVNGGIWKTINATDTAQIRWSPITDDLPSLSIGAMSFGKHADGRVDSTTIYAGTGSFSSHSDTGGQPIGIIKIVDSGVEQTVTLMGRDTFANLPITDIVPVDNQQILVSTVDRRDRVDNVVDRGGVFFTADGGTNWQRQDQAAMPLPMGGVTSLTHAGDIADLTHLYCGNSQGWCISRCPCCGPNAYSRRLATYRKWSRFYTSIDKDFDFLQPGWSGIFGYYWPGQVHNYAGRTSYPSTDCERSKRRGS